MCPANQQLVTGYLRFGMQSNLGIRDQVPVSAIYVIRSRLAQALAPAIMNEYMTGAMRAPTAEEACQLLRRLQQREEELAQRDAELQAANAEVRRLRSQVQAAADEELRRHRLWQQRLEALKRMIYRDNGSNNDINNNDHSNDSNNDSSNDNDNDTNKAMKDETNASASAARTAQHELSLTKEIVIIISLLNHY